MIYAQTTPPGGIHCTTAPAALITALSIVTVEVIKTGFARVVTTTVLPVPISRTCLSAMSIVVGNCTASSSFEDMIATSLFSRSFSGDEIDRLAL